MAVNLTVSGDNLGNIVVGDHNVVITAGAGAVVYAGEGPAAPRPVSRRVDLRPRPFPDLLDRREETVRAIGALTADGRQPIELSGPAGIGKTSLLRWISWDPAVEATARDGILYFDATGQTVDDLLQQVFEALFICDVRFKPTAVQLRGLLADRSALVMLDHFSATGADLQRLLNLAATMSWIAVTTQRVLVGEGCAVSVRGLLAGDGLELIARELGRPLAADEMSAARRLVDEFEGNPLALAQAAAHARVAGLSIATVALALRAAPNPTAALAAAVQSALGADERKALAALAAVDGAPLEARAAAEIAKLADAETALDKLCDRRLVAFDGKRYRLLAAAGTIVAGTIAVLMLASALPAEAALAHFAAASGGMSSTELVENSAAIVAALRRSAAHGNFGDALQLAHRAGDALALSGRWDRWHEILRLNLEVARAVHDPAAEARALHQLGTRSLALGDAAAAQASLGAALRIRAGLDDTAGLAATRRNLTVLAAMTAAAPAAGISVGMKIAIGAVGAAALASVGGWFGVVAPGPKIAKFTATHVRIQEGYATTLCYAVEHAQRVDVDHGVAEPGPQSTCIDVSPRTTTAYTLNATGTLGRHTARTVVVQVAARIATPRPSVSPSPTRTAAPAAPAAPPASETSPSPHPRTPAPRPTKTPGIPTPKPPTPRPTKTPGILTSKLPTSRPTETPGNAPPDISFGRTYKLTVLGIYNHARCLGHRIEENAAAPDSELAFGALIEDAIRDWEFQYPRDVDLPREVLLMEIAYGKAHTPSGLQRTTLMRSWLLGRYPKSPGARMSISAIRAAKLGECHLTKDIFTSPPPHVLPTETPAMIVTPTPTFTPSR